MIEVEKSSAENSAYINQSPGKSDGPLRLGYNKMENSASTNGLINSNNSLIDKKLLQNSQGNAIGGKSVVLLNE